MAKGTTALGILFELKDKASRGIRSLATSVDMLSTTMGDASAQGNLFTKSLEKGKVSRVWQAAGAIKSLGSAVLTASVSSKSLIASVGELVGAIPVIGPIVEKSAGFLFNMATRIGEVRGEQNRWRVQLIGLGADMKALTPRVQDVAKVVGMSSVEVMRLARSMGDVSEEGLKMTETAAQVGRSFDVANEDAAALVKTTGALGMAGASFKELGGEAVKFGRQFKLPLMQELPELADEARKSMLLLGGSLKSRLGPSVLLVGKAAGILTKQLGMMPKQALAVAKTMVGQFKGLAVNLENVFTGVDDDFEGGTQDLMEMFVRSGKSGTDAMAAIQKAANEQDYTELSDAFSTVMAQGGIGARRMKAQLQKTFGPEFGTIMGKMTTDGKEAFDKMFPKEAEVKEPAEVFDESVNKMLNSADNLENRLTALSDSFVNSMAENMPKVFDEVENAFKQLLDRGGSAQTKLAEFFATKDSTVAEVAKKFFTENFMPAVDALFEGIKNGLGPTFDALSEKFDTAINVISGIVTVLGSIQDGFRNLLSMFGLARSVEEEKAERARLAAVGKMVNKPVMEMSKAEIAHNMALTKPAREAAEQEAAAERSRQAQIARDNDMRYGAWKSLGGYRPAQKVEVVLKASSPDYNGNKKMEAHKAVDLKAGLPAGNN